MHVVVMDAQWDPEDYRPREEDALLALTVEPSKTPLRTWMTFAVLAAVVVANGVLMGRPDAVAALLLPGLFFFVGFRVLLHRPARTSLRFLDEGVELSTDAQGWVRVPWALITRLVMNAAGGASLDTGTFEEGGRAVARLPKEQVVQLLAAAVLPAHVELIDAPAAAPHNSKKTFGLWLVLIIVFVAVWQLTQS